MSTGLRLGSTLYIGIAVGFYGGGSDRCRLELTRVMSPQRTAAADPRAVATFSLALLRLSRP